MGKKTKPAEKKRIEDALWESEEKYRLLIENFNGSITLISKEGVILLINRRGAKWFEKTPEEIIGRSLNNLFPAKAKELEMWEKTYLPSRDMGILAISTPQGVLSHKEAKEKNVGGSLLAFVY